jgi:phenylacetate-CoA ligase
MQQMTTPTDSPQLHASLRQMLQGVLTSSRSAFYRERFKDLAIDASFPQSLIAWQTLPLLSRPDITAWSFWERTYTPRSEVMMIRNTNGTTEKKPLFTPRKTFGDYAAMPAMAGVKRQLAFLTMWYSSEESRRSRGALFVNGMYPQSPDDFKLAARMVRLVNADSICCSPLLALMLAPHLRAEGVIDNITSIEFSGDRCTPAQRDSFLKLYNNPKIYQNYSASESAGIFGVPCEWTLENRSLAFHITDDMLMSEFVDPDTGEAKDAHEPAELVVSSLTADQPLPLIRYRTGDMLVVDADECPCGRGVRFQMVGRATSDRIRFLNGEFSLTEIERVLAQIPEIDPQDYEVHYSEHAVEKGVLRPQMHLKLLVHDGVEMASLAEKISRLLPHTANDSYATLVEKGFVEPLTVGRLLDPQKTVTGKRVRMFKY